MLENLFLLNGFFNKAHIPLIEDSTRTCEEYLQAESTNMTSSTYEVVIGSLVFLALFAYIWLHFKKKYYKNKRY